MTFRRGTSLPTAVCMIGLALVVGAAAAGEARPAAGAGQSSPGVPESREVREALVGRLIDEYRNPPEPAAPTAAEQSEIDKVLSGFAAESYQEREAASAAAVKVGVVALAAMRKAAASQDMEVAERAARAIVELERARRESLVRRMEEVPDSAAILDAKLGECERAWAGLAMAVPAAEREGREAEVTKLRAEMARLDALMITLRTIREKPAPPEEPAD